MSIKYCPVPRSDEYPIGSGLRQRIREEFPITARGAKLRAVKPDAKSKGNGLVLHLDGSMDQTQIAWLNRAFGASTGVVFVSKADPAAASAHGGRENPSKHWGSVAAAQSEDIVSKLAAMCTANHRKVVVAP